MAAFKKIDDGFAVAGQLAEADLHQAQADGFSCIINNRPDGEDTESLQDDEVRSLAEKLGLAYHHVPVTPGSMSPEQVGMIREIIDGTPGPILAYCRSGMRSSMLWGLAMAGRVGTDDIIERAAMAGYDISSVKPVIEVLAQQND